MAGSTITQRIALEGAEQIRQALAQIAKAGQEAFGQIQQAGENVKLDRPLGAVEAAATRAATSIEGMRTRVTGAAGAFGTASSAAPALGGQVEGMATAMSGAECTGAALAGALITTGTVLRGIGSAVEAGARQFTNLNFGVASIVGVFKNAAGEVLKTTAVLGALPAALFAVAKSAASTAGEIRRNAIQVGTSTTRYQEFAGAVGKLGADEEGTNRAFSVIEQHIGNLNQVMDDLRRKSPGFLNNEAISVQELSRVFPDLRQQLDQAAGAFGRYGIALTDASGRAHDPIDIFRDVADHIAAIPDPADRAARAIEFFTRRIGPQLLPVLQKGSQGIRQIGRDLQRQGLILTPDQIGVGVEMNRAVGLLRLSVTRLKDSIGFLFAPQFTATANLFRQAITDNRAAVIAFAADIAAKSRPVLLDLARALSGQDQEIQTGWILTAKAQFLELGSAIATVVGSVIVPALKIFAGLMQETANAINAVFGTRIMPADIAVTFVVTKLAGGFLKLLGVLSVFHGAWSVVLRIIGALGGPLNIVLTVFRALGGVIGIVARGAALLAAAIGGLPLLIAAVGFAIGFLAVRLAQGIDWQKLADGAASVVSQIAGFFSGLWGTISELFVAGIAQVSGLWAIIVAGAQTVWGTISSGASALWDGLALMWQSGIQRIGAFWNVIVSGASELWGKLNGVFQAGFELVSAGWDAIVTAAQTVFATLAGLAQGAWSGIISGAQSMWATIAGAFSSGVDAVIGFLGRLRDFALSVWDAITGAAREAASAQSDAATADAAPFARGGPVRGAGTATSDSVPAWLSNGEFVIRAAAVRKYGLSLFDALNRLRIDPGTFRRFAQGGLVRSLQVLMPPISPPRLAEGGFVPAPTVANNLRPINLQIGPEMFAGMLAPEDVAQKLMRVAVTRQIRSAGRKPSYYGNGR